MKGAQASHDGGCRRERTGRQRLGAGTTWYFCTEKRSMALLRVIVSRFHRADVHM